MATLRLTGAGPSKNLSLRVQQALRPTQGDLLQALAEQQSRILERTEKGLDYQGKPFAPYSEKGPYYYYPNGPVGKVAPGQRKGFRARLTRFARQGRGGTRTRSGLGLRFPSYRAFKLNFLGRSNVDLRGARAPHMLQQMVMTVEGKPVSASNASRATRLSATEQMDKATTGTLGIYGEAGARASGHNEGTRRLPQRRFCDASDRDLDAMAERLADRAVARALAALDGK